MATNNFVITDSNHNPINIPANASKEQIESLFTESKARWLVVGQVDWTKDDDIVSETKVNQATLKALSDTFVHNIYTRTVLKGQEYHAYNTKKQTGFSPNAGVIRSDESPNGWARVSFVAGRPEITAEVKKLIKSEMGTRREFETVTAVPEQMAARHDMVSYFLSEDFKGIRVVIPPFHYQYFATIIAQYVNDDKEDALDDRNQRVANAGIQRTVIRPAIHEAYNAEGAKEVVEAADRTPILFTTVDGSTVNLWDVPAGKYGLALLSHNSGRIVSQFDWDGEGSLEWATKMAKAYATRYAIQIES